MSDENAQTDYSDDPFAQLVIAYVEEHWTGDRTCPICLESSWTVSEPGRLPVGAALDTVYYTLFPVSCKNCGYTFLLNGLIADLPSSRESM